MTCRHALYTLMVSAAVLVTGCKEKLPWSECGVGSHFKYRYAPGVMSVIVDGKGTSVVPSGNEPGNDAGDDTPGVSQLAITGPYVVGSASVAGPPSISFYFALDTRRGRPVTFDTRDKFDAFLTEKQLGSPVLLAPAQFLKSR